MTDELRRCFKCGYETNEALKRCPRCGLGLQSTKQVRRLGWLVLALGLFIVGLMGTITFQTAPALLQPREPMDSEQFTGTAAQGALILTLFSLVIAFGLIAVINGLFQIKTGRRSKALIYFSFGLLILVAIAAGFLMSARGG